MTAALTPAERERLETLFERAADLPPAEHAAFEVCETGFGVRDLASTNGVRVNGKEVLSAVLEHGDRVRLGDCELQYVVETRERPVKAWSVDGEA